MSSENSVYILATPNLEAPEALEYRVLPEANVECICWNDTAHRPEPYNFRVQIENARKMFGECEVFYSELEALRVANREMRKRGHIEYRVEFIEIPRQFQSDSLCRDCKDIPNVKSEALVEKDESDSIINSRVCFKTVMGGKKSSLVFDKVPSHFKVAQQFLMNRMYQLFGSDYKTKKLRIKILVEVVD